MARDGMKRRAARRDPRARLEGGSLGTVNAGVQQGAGDFTACPRHDSLAAQMGFVDGAQLAAQVEEMLLDQGRPGCENSWRVADLFGLECWLRVFFTGRSLGCA